MSKRIRRKLSDATKFKMRLAKLGTKNPMSGKHHTEETKRKSEKIKGLLAINSDRINYP